LFRTLTHVADRLRRICCQASLIPNAALTTCTVASLHEIGPARVRRLVLGENLVSAFLIDTVFVLLIAGLYAATHWMVWLLSRLGAAE
jgi:hypothetical protein